MASVGVSPRRFKTSSARFFVFGSIRAWTTADLLMSFFVSQMQHTVNHDLRRNSRRIRNELGITCSTTELLRHLEQEAGLEPATSRVTGDNPILRPVEK